MQIICPKCKSNDAQLLSIIYDANISYSHTTFEGKSSTSENITTLGMKVAPPSPPHSNILIIIRTILLWLLIITTLNALGQDLLLRLFFYFFVPIYLFFRLRANARYKRKYRKLLKTWNNSFMCQHCGTRFEAHFGLK